MNKNIIALAVAAAAFASQATAVELYNNNGSTFAIGGHLSISAKGNVGDVALFETIEGKKTQVGYEDGSTSMIANSPRINFNFTQDLGNGFTADTRGEWALNMLDGGGETFKTRLGYIGLSHENFGRAVAGTQWSPYYDVAGITDMPIAFANDFLYDDHGNLGTGRAEKMFSYRNGVDISDSISFDGGIAVQDNDGDYSNRGQVALSLNIADFMVGYAYSAGDRKVDSRSEAATSHVISAKYGSYGNGLYVAGVYTLNEYMDSTSNYNTGGSNNLNNDLLDDSNAMEFIAAYAFANSLNLSINYEAVESNDKAVGEGTVYSQMAFQAEYGFTSKFIGFAGYQLDLGSDQVKQENDMWNVGVRYYL